MKKILTILILLSIVVLGLNILLFLSKDKKDEKKDGEVRTIIPTIAFTDGHEETDSPLTVPVSTDYFVVYYSFLSEGGYAGVGVSDVLCSADLEENYNLYIRSDKSFDEIFKDSETGKFQRNVVYLTERGD